MKEFFAYDYTGTPFVFFGSAHIGALAVILLLNLYLMRYRNRDEKTRRRVRITLAVVILADESAWHIWNICHGTWSVQEHLPLHACSVLIWLAGFMLFKKNYRVYEFAYFIGIGGALQALLTPDIGVYGFPHFRFFQTYTSHGLLVTSAVFMTAVESMRPTWKSILRVIVISNIYMGVVFLINNLIGSNYLYVAHKPQGPTLLDALPEWPWYLLYMEAIGLVMFLLLYLPFAVGDRRAKKSPSSA